MSYREFIHESINNAAHDSDEIESVPGILEITLQGKIIIEEHGDSEEDGRRVSTTMTDKTTLFTLHPKEMSFKMHSMVKKRVKVVFM